MVLLLVVGLSDGASSDSFRVVQASEILAKIENGTRVDYKFVVVEGDLDLSELDLPTGHVERTEYEIAFMKLTEEVKLVASPINITNSMIQGNVSFGNAIFMNSTIFRWTNFSGGYTNFVGADFVGAADFWSADFSGIAYFIGANFGSDADFGYADFDDNTNFWCANFSDNASFWGADFGDNTNFWCANFSDNASFGDAYFDGASDFNGVDFCGYADFYDAYFDGASDFRYADFYGYADFYDAYFDGASDFSGANFSGVSDFRYADFNGSADFREAHFFESVDLSGVKFVSFEVDWNSINQLVCDGPAYLELVKNFKTLEQFEDADSCYYQYRQWRQDTKSWLIWSKYIDILAHLSCGYGVRPSYTLCWSFGIILLFGLALWIGNGIYRSKTPQNEGAYEKTWAISTVCSVSLKKILFLSRRILHILVAILKMVTHSPKIIWIILFKLGPSELLGALRNIGEMSFTTNVSFKDSLYFSSLVFVSQPPHDWRPKEGWKYAVMIEDILGWLLLALFLVTLGNVMIR